MRFESRPRRPRAPRLTPLIDVVFLLLVFFMLASRFDAEDLRPLVLQRAGAAPAASDALRLEIGGDGLVRMGGRVVSQETLVSRAARAASAGRSVVATPDPEATLQRVLDVLTTLEEGGVTDVALGRSTAP